MICGFNILTVMNFLASFLILAVGSAVYIKTKDKTPFHLGVAFGLFAVSHLISLMDLEANFVITTMLLRAFGYVIVLLVIGKMWSKKCC